PGLFASIYGSTPIGIPGSATSRSGSYGFGSQSGESGRSGPTTSGSSSGSYGGSCAGAPGRGKGLSRLGPGTVAMPRLPSFRLALPDAAGGPKGAEDVPWSDLQNRPSARDLAQQTQHVQAKDLHDVVLRMTAREHELRDARHVRRIAEAGRQRQDAVEVAAERHVVCAGDAHEMVHVVEQPVHRHGLERVELRAQPGIRLAPRALPVAVH